MKFCPNKDCPHARRVGRPAEYTEQVSTCADCGTELVEAEASAVEAVVSPDRTQPPLGRLVITLICAVVPFALTWIPIPGLDQGVVATLGPGATPGLLSIAALGLTSVFGAFQLVELIALVVPRLRPRRISGPGPRTRLVLAAFALAVLMCTSQAYFIALWTEGVGYGTGLAVVAYPGWGFRIIAMAALVAGAMIMVGAAFVVSRWGLGAGFAALLAGSMLTALLDNGRQMFQRLQVGDATLFSLLLWLGAYAALAAVTAWIFRAHSRWRQSGEDATVRLPTSGLVPLIWAASALGVPSLASNLGFYWQPLSEWLERFSQQMVPGATIYLMLLLVMVAGFGVAFAQLFYRPDLVAALAGRAESLIRPQVWRRALISVAYLGGLVLAEHLLAQSGVRVSLILGVYITAAALDLRAEWQARRAVTSPLVKVWELHRIYAVEPLREALLRHEITPCFRGLHVRGLLYFFGPYIPVDVLVPRARSAEALELAQELLIPEEENEAVSGGVEALAVPGPQ